MIRFFIKGLLRDRGRSLFPIIIVTLGVMFTVFLHCWMTGILGDVIDFSAKFSTGDVKIMSRAYAENKDQIPNDLALMDVNTLIDSLQNDYPDMTWVQRIRFGGLLDIPDSARETRAQSPVMGIAIDLLSPGSKEIDRMNIRKSLVRGHLPDKPDEILISDAFARKLKVNPGQIATLISSTMFGSMSLQNFTIAGTVNFGTDAMDRGTIIADIGDIRKVLDMQDAAGEILGYFNSDFYNDAKAIALAKSFNKKYENSSDKFAPEMFSLSEQDDLGTLLGTIDVMKSIIVFVFVLAMSIVLWNAGLLGGLRRYGEVGLRIAIGEEKGHVYRSMIYESIIIGIFGSITGTIVGLAISYWFQAHGLDFGDIMRNASIMMPSVYRAHVTPQAYYIGFFPGVLSTVLGTMLSGIGIYKRKTAQLFKELEA